MRSIWEIDLRVTADSYAEDTMMLVVVINKPKEFIPNLFEFKRKKTYETVELLNGVFSRGHYYKDDVRVREYRVDYVFVDLRNLAKRKEFVADMLGLKEKGLDVRTVGSYLRERRDLIDKK